MELLPLIMLHRPIDRKGKLGQAMSKEERKRVEDIKLEVGKGRTYI
jgi:hypothetical protein